MPRIAKVKMWRLTKEDEKEMMKKKKMPQSVKISMMQANNDAKVVCISDISTISLVPE